jgi:hypothetical protein
MKKYLSLTALIAVVLISMSFLLLPSKKTDKHHKLATVKTPPVKKPVCNCAIPTITSAVRSGGFVTVKWTATTGAVNYSLGGYYSCLPYGFSYCVGATTQYTFPSSCWVTVRVNALCNGSNCTNVTCSSGPSAPFVSS